MNGLTRGHTWIPCIPLQGCSPGIGRPDSPPGLVGSGPDFPSDSPPPCACCPARGHCAYTTCTSCLDICTSLSAWSAAFLTLLSPRPALPRSSHPGRQARLRGDFLSPMTHATVMTGSSWRPRSLVWVQMTLSRNTGRRSSFMGTLRVSLEGRETEFKIRK